MKGTALILLALLATAGSARAATVSKEVGPLLREAQQMLAAKNYTGASAALDEADAVASTADDRAIINQFRQVVTVASMDRSKPNCTGQTEITNCKGRPLSGPQP
jgi:hypothetical protein